MRGAKSVLLTGALLSSCANTQTGERAEIPLQRGDARTWKNAREELHGLSTRYRPTQPFTSRISLRLTEPFTGRVVEARGAVAVKPPDALRMILLGPGGTTALDFWVSKDKYRFFVPSLGLLERSDTQRLKSRSLVLPIGFLRWWLLAPTQGTLLSYGAREGAERFLILENEGGAAIDLTLWEDASLVASRRVRTPFGVNEETIVATTLGCGDAHYEHVSSYVRVSIHCESYDERSEPSPRAFVDPDAPKEERP